MVGWWGVGVLVIAVGCGGGGGDDDGGPEPAPEPESTTSTASAATTAATTAPPGSAGDGRVEVPDVVGLDLQLAQDTMQADGFYVLVSHDATGDRKSVVWERV